MVPSDPRIRAAITQILLGGVERLLPGERAAILAVLGAGDARAIHEMLPVGYCPMDLHMRLADAIRGAIGSERNVGVWTATMSALFERPLLRGFVKTSTALFGMSPSTFVRQGDRIYAQISHDLGELSTSVDASGLAGDISLLGFPASRFSFACYVEGLQGCIASILPLGRAKGRVTVVDLDEGRGDARYRIEWAPAGS